MSVNIDRLLKDYFPFETVHEGEPDWKKVNPLASDEQPEDRNGSHQVESFSVPAEAQATLARRYRVRTKTLDGGDRDKFNAQNKAARRVRRSLHAGNLAGPIGIEISTRQDIANGSGKRSD